MSQTIAGLILAAGKGTRMKSAMPKCLHAVCGTPMADLVGRALDEAGVYQPILVIGHEGEQLQAALGEKYRYVWQREQLGTGHAVLMAQELLQNHEGPVLVAAGDTPLLSAEVVAELLAYHRAANANCTLATAIVDDPHGYGRIVRKDGAFSHIVEQREATAEEQEIKEVNAALYVFEAADLFRILPTLGKANKQGEYYLTDVLEKLVGEGKYVEAKIFRDASILKGVNDRWQLAEADRELRLRTLKRHAMNGVTLIDPESIYIGLDVSIGPDTVIEPQTYISGDTAIGANCHIGPSTRIKSSEIGDGCYIYFSQIDQAVLHNGVKVGPFSHLRPGTILHKAVKIGNFVEVKKSTLGEGTAVNHLSYIGDATVGVRTNIGAGTITCNYDGFRKHQTTIGDGVFVGSNSTLVAPVTLSNGAIIAAGSVITKDVPENSGAFGRARQETREGWAQQWRQKRNPQS